MRAEIETDQHSSSGFDADDHTCKDIFVRAGGLTREGYGSFFQRIKASIILSMTLNRTLLLAEDVHSEHNYSVTAQINEAYEDVHVYNEQRAECVVRQNQSALHNCDLQLHEREATALDLACRAMHAPSGRSGSKDLFAASAIHPADWLAVLQANQSCSDVYQTKDEVPGQFAEDYEGFNDCIQPWLSTTFHNMFERRAYKLPLSRQPDRLHVGIHIRWGDVATPNVSNLDARSVQLSEIRACVRALQQTGKRFEFYLFVKNPSETLLSEVDFHHTVVNNEDDLYDMFLYSHMDMYIQGISSFSVIASLINPHKIVITNQPASAKYRFDYFQVNNVFAISNLSYVHRVLDM
jgi:hypothetical protein